MQVERLANGRLPSKSNLENMKLLCASCESELFLRESHIAYCKECEREWKNDSGKERPCTLRFIFNGPT